MDQSEIDLAISEHSALRDEILFLTKQSYITENAIVIGTSALYGWALANSPTEFSHLVWWIPVLVSLLGGVREIGIRTRVSHIGSYLAILEKTLKKESKIGWEHYLADIRKKKNGKLLGLSSGLFWIALILMSFVVAILMSK